MCSSDLNIIQEVGEFSVSLPIALVRLPFIDFAYFDGNHRRKATLDYFYACLDKRGENSVFVFDDIYWSREMAQAWNEIRNHPSVTVSMDLYSMGIIFFHTTQPKQHFKLKF